MKQIVTILRRADKSLQYQIAGDERKTTDIAGDEQKTTDIKCFQMPTYNCYYNQSTDIIYNIYYTSRLKEMGLIFSVLLSTITTEYEQNICHFRESYSSSLPSLLI